MEGNKQVTYTIYRLLIPLSEVIEMEATRFTSRVLSRSLSWFIASHALNQDRLLDLCGNQLQIVAHSLRSNQQSLSHLQFTSRENSTTTLLVRISLTSKFPSTLLGEVLGQMIAMLVVDVARSPPTWRRNSRPSMSVQTTSRESAGKRKDNRARVIFCFRLSLHACWILANATPRRACAVQWCNKMIVF